MAGPTDALEKRLAELKKEVTRRGFNKHASLLKSVLELPAELWSPVVSELAVRETIHAIIVFPPQIQRGWNYVPKQALLFTEAGLTHLLASIWPDQGPQVTCIKACDLIYMKVTLLLLYGFLEIVAQGLDSPTRLGMEFNTVARHRLSSPLRQLLAAAKTKPPLPADEASIPPDTRQALRQLPVKFSNGVKIYGLLPGEELVELVFQPETWKPWLYFFRQPMLANTLLLLTTNYLVVIQEELNVKQGWLLSYIPRENVIGMQNQPGGQWNEICVQLARGGQSVDYKLLLHSEAAETWRLQWLQHGGRWTELPGQMGMN
ncbi:MAG: hypothetical protein AB1649_01925 [Chloroflexota bacterium]